VADTGQLGPCVLHPVEGAGELLSLAVRALADVHDQAVPDRIAACLDAAATGLVAVLKNGSLAA
jgi:hypothetical protein